MNSYCLIIGAPPSKRSPALDRHLTDHFIADRTHPKLSCPHVDQRSLLKSCHLDHPEHLSLVSLACYPRTMINLQGNELASTKRTRGPSAFAPAVGVKQSGVQGNYPSLPGAKQATKKWSTDKSGLNGETSKPRKSGRALKSAIVHFLSGGLAAGLVRASLQPLDTCKTRLQATPIHSISSSSVAIPARPITSVLFAGGLSGLYKGVIPGVLGIVPAAAVYMVTFQTLRSELGRLFPRRRNDVVVAMSAAVADVGASLVRVPCEVLKQRLQVGVYRNVLHAVRMSFNGSLGKGVTRLYAGLGAQLVRDVPYAAVEFVVYENVKSNFMRKQMVASARKGVDLGQRDVKMKRTDGLVIGGIAGAVAAIVSNPADVVKTRLMTQVRNGGTPYVAGQRAYRGVCDTFVRIAREEGFATFGKGIAPRIAAKALQSALFFAAYEGLRRAIGNAVGVDPSDSRELQSAH